MESRSITWTQAYNSKLTAPIAPIVNRLTIAGLHTAILAYNMSREYRGLDYFMPLTHMVLVALPLEEWIKFVLVLQQTNDVRSDDEASPRSQRRLANSLTKAKHSDFSITISNHAILIAPLYWGLVGYDPNETVFNQLLPHGIAGAIRFSDIVFNGLPFFLYGKSNNNVTGCYAHIKHVVNQPIVKNALTSALYATLLCGYEYLLRTSESPLYDVIDWQQDAYKAAIFSGVSVVASVATHIATASAVKAIRYIPYFREKSLTDSSNSITVENTPREEKSCCSRLISLFWQKPSESTQVFDGPTGTQVNTRKAR